MARHPHRPPAAERLTVEAIRRREFGTAFRGYDPLEVRAFLAGVADRIAESEQARVALESELASPRRAGPDLGALDETALTAALGEETARVLLAAREAAADIARRSEEKVAALLAEAAERAKALTVEADARLETARAAAAEVEASAADRATALEATARDQAEATVAAAASAAADVQAAADRRLAEIDDEAHRLLAEAEATAVDLLKGAEDQAALVRQRADDDADRMRAEAASDGAATVEEAAAQAQVVLAEAEGARDQVLRDLAKRRHTARAQLEQLRAGRDRLLDAYEVVRHALDEATHELNVSLGEARLAAETAKFRAQSDAEDSPEALRSELHLAPSMVAGPARVPAEAPARHPDEPVGVFDTGEIIAVLSDPPVPASPDADHDVDDVGGRSWDGWQFLRRRADEVVPSPAISSEPAPEPTSEPAPEPPSAAAAAPATPDPVEIADVDPPGSPLDLAEPAGRRPALDALFAQIRKDREVAVAEAEAVLDPAATDESTDDDGASTDGVDPLAARDALATDLCRRLGKRLKQALADEQNQVMDAVRREGARQSVEDLLGLPEAHAERYVGVADPVLVEAGAAGATLAGDGAITSPSVDVTAVAATLAGELCTPLRRRIERCGIDANGDLDALDDLLRSAYREWKGQRVGPLVEHAVLSALTAGQLAATPVGCRLRWVVDAAGTPCPDAEDNALAGDLVPGSEFPTGHCGPPAHPGCRCALAVVTPVTVLV